MKKMVLIVGLLMIAGLVLLAGCGSQGGGGSNSGNPGGGGNQAEVSVSSLFNVSGAKAIATASKLSGGTAASGSSASNYYDIVKLTASGEISSIFNSSVSWGYRPQVSVIEKGPDGALYVGFANKMYFYSPSTVESNPGMVSSGAAFLKITSDGSIEVVDSTIDGMGSWYSAGSGYGEIPVKQVQFDNAGNVYYLGSSSSSGDWNTVLKKKTIAGVISQIGSSSMRVRDFVVLPSGFVLFHGSDAGSWSTEWLRTKVGSSTYYIFANDTSSGNYGYLRTYFMDKNGNVLLVGKNLTMTDPVTEEDKKYSGVIRVKLNASGKPATLEVLYDDNNMYGTDNYNTIGSQLMWGVWDGVNQRKFFKGLSATNTTPTLPLVIVSGESEATIRAFIRGKYHAKTSDTLDNISFEGVTTTETWTISTVLDNLISSNISGETWAQWRDNNGLNGVQFGDAKQMLFADDGSVYAVMNLDGWSASLSKGNKIFRIINSNGTAEMTAFTQHTSYKSISKARCYGNYIIYLSSKVAGSKIFRVDITNPTATPVDLTSGKGSVVIYSFNYNPASKNLIYDVFDNDTSTSYVVEQAIETATVASEKAAGSGYTITDVVPFTSTQ